MKIISGIKKYLLKILNIVTGISFAAMVISLILQVVFRYVLQISVAWTEELARFLCIWTVFLGAAPAFYEDDHITVDALVSKMSNEKYKKIVLYIALTFMYIFIASAIYGGFKLYSLGMRDWATTMPIRMGYVYLALPVGAVMMVVLKLIKLIEDISKKYDKAGGM